MKRCKNMIWLAMLLLSMVTRQASAQEYFMPPKNIATPTVQLHSNALYWLALVPNVGVELQTNSGLAFQLDYMGAWWNSSSHNHYYSCYGFQTDLRYYLGDTPQNTPFVGHHVGVYGQLMTYDFEFGGKGYQCANLFKTWGVGVAYGYVLPLTSRLSADFTIGIGYLSSRYTAYEPTPSWFRATSYGSWTYFGPTRLEATLVYNINMFNNK